MTNVGRHKNRISLIMTKKFGDRGKVTSKKRSPKRKFSKTKYEFRPEADYLANRKQIERLDLTETDDDEDEGVGDGNIGQKNADFGNGLREA